MKIIFNKLKIGKIAADSMWSVCGNAISLFFMLLGGIIIARVVGREVYGQYGTVKSLMTSFASLAAFGLGYSSTKLISFSGENTRGLHLKMFKMVCFVSVVIWLLIVFLSKPLSNLMNKPELDTYFIYIGILMFLKAIWTLFSGTLAGYKMFKQISINNVISAVVMIIIVFPMTKILGFKGAVYSLITYQGLNALLCYLCVHEKEKRTRQNNNYSYWKIFKFSFPIAIHEMSFTISSIAYVLIMLNYSSYGEYGIYSISTQWNAIIVIIPTLLMNVTLSYLSSRSGIDAHRNLVKKMLLLNLGCTLVPLLLIFIFSNFVVNLYGDNFKDLLIVLRISIIGTIFSSLVLVFQSNLISQGRNWNLAIYKLCRDSFLIIALIYVLNNYSQRSAFLAVLVDMITCFFYFLVLAADYYYNNKKMRQFST